MPAQAHRRRYLYLEAHRPWEWPFGHLGKEYIGLVFGRWPLLAAFRDRTFYYDVGTFGICLGPWLELGLFIDFRSVDEIMKDNIANGFKNEDPERSADQSTGEQNG